MVSPSDISTFWFEETEQKLWFNATDAFDADIRNRFETLAIKTASTVKRKSRHEWESEPEHSLALILLLDQFPRNMYRNTPGAFAWDALALGVAQGMVEKAWDLKIPQSRRAFIYMPFMHAEDLAVQEKCVALCDSRLDDASTLFHAKAHRDTIKNFGRFPHRNEILGRETTQAEQQYLDSGGYAP